MAANLPMNRFTFSRRWYSQAISIIAFGMVVAIGGGELRAAEVDASSTESTAPFGQIPSSGHFPYTVLQSMWRQQLYEIANRHCESQRALTKPGTDTYALWTLWRIEGLGRWGVDDPAKGEEKLLEINRLFEKFQSDPGNSKRLPWIELQRLRAQWLRAQQLLALYQAANARDKERLLALDAVRKLLEESESLRERTAKQASLSSRVTQPSTDYAPTKQYQILLADLSLLEVDAFRIRCECYPAKSTDRITAVSQMHEAIEKALARVPSDWKGKSSLELTRAEGHLLLLKYQVAIESLEQALPLVQDTKQRYQMLAVLTDAYRLAGDLVKARQILTAIGDPLQSPYLAMSELELQLAEVHTKGDQPQEQSRRMKGAIEWKNQIGERFGAYWLQRAEGGLVAGSSGLANSTKDLSGQPTNEVSVATQLMRTEAKQLLAGGKKEAALQRLFAARDKSKNEGSREMAFSIGIEIAALLQSFQKPTEAVKAYREAANEATNHPKAPAAHLMACWLLSAQLTSIQEGTTEEPEKVKEVSELYQVLLEEHVRSWPDDESTKQARGWLDQFFLESDRLKECSNQWMAQLSTSVDSMVLSHAVGRGLLETIASRCGLENLEERARLDQLLNRLKSMSSEKDLAKSSEIRLAFDWIRWAAVDRTWNQAMGPRPMFTGSLPEKELDRVDSKTETGSNLGRLLRGMIELLERAIQGKEPSQGVAENLETLWQDPSTAPLAWPFLEAIFEAVDSMPKEQRKAWVSVVDSMIEKTETTFLPKSIAIRLNLRRQTMMLRNRGWKGDRATAEADFEVLLKSLPNDDFLLSQWAAFQIEAPSAGDQKGIEVYQKLATKAKPGTPIWFEARIRLAAELRNLGKKKEAKQTLGLAVSTYPKMPTVWSERFKTMLETLGTVP